MSREALDELKQQIPLLDYLQAHDWHPARRLNRGRLIGLCPLHADHKPSFLLDPGKDLFYCYGCGRGGDVIRFAELYHQVTRDLRDGDLTGNARPALLPSVDTVAKSAGGSLA